MRHQDIAALVKKAKKGDKKAMTALYEQSQNSVYFLALRMLGGNEQDAQDTVQNTYIKAFSSLGTLKDDSKFIPWLNQIAVNESKQFLRKQNGKNILFVGDFDTENIAEIAEDFIPAEFLESSERRRLILKLIDELPINQKLCVMYYYYHNMTIAEIAAELSESESTIKSRLNYAKSRIKRGVEALEKDGTKLYGVGAMPILSQIMRSASEDSTIPAAASKQILANTLSSAAVTGSMAGMGGVAGMATKFALLSTGAKIAVSSAVAVALVGAVAVPVIYVHNKNEQEAVMAMAVIQQEEADRAASEAAEIERIAREAGASRVAAESKAAAEAEAERVHLEAEAEAARIAEEEAEAARLEDERLAAEQAEQAAIAAQQAQQAAVQAPAASAPAGNGQQQQGGQQPQKTPPNGQKEGNTNELAPGTKLPGGITVVDRVGDAGSAYN